MDWNLILNYVLKILGTAVGTIIVTYASILYAKLKTKIGEAKLITYIDKCVKAAEQLFPNLGQKTGKEKYEYVLNCIKEKYPKLEESYLKPLIEGCVYEVSEQVKLIAEIENDLKKSSITNLTVE